MGAVRVLSKQAKVWLCVGCYARIRCGFPVKKGFSVGTTYRSGGRAVGILRFVVLVRCQANKLSKQAKAWCLMLCGCGAVAVVWC